MWKSIRWRATLIAVLTAFSIAVVLPSLTDNLPESWRRKAPKIHLGLDLQGGVFLRLAVEIDKAIENAVLRYADEARAVCREKGIPVLGSQKDGSDGFLLRFPPGDFAGRAMTLLKEEMGSLDIALGEVRPDGATVISRMKPAEVQSIRANAVTQGVDTIRNRIDPEGVREAQVIPEGEDRIVI